MHHDDAIALAGRCSCVCHETGIKASQLNKRGGCKLCSWPWPKITTALAPHLTICRKCKAIRTKGEPCLVCVTTQVKPFGRWHGEVRAVKFHKEHLLRPLAR